VYKAISIHTCIATKPVQRWQIRPIVQYQWPIPCSNNIHGGCIRGPLRNVSECLYSLCVRFIQYCYSQLMLILLCDSVNLVFSGIELWTVMGYQWPMFKQHPRWLYTWTSPDGNIRNQIDYNSVGRTCGSACSSTHPGSRIAVLLFDFLPRRITIVARTGRGIEQTSSDIETETSRYKCWLC